MSMVIAILLLSTCSFIVFAESDSLSCSELSEEGNYNINDVVFENLKSLTTDTDRNITVQIVKQLSDFDGNKYYVVEFLNEGYVIFHGESGEIT